MTPSLLSRQMAQIYEIKKPTLNRGDKMSPLKVGMG